MFHISICLVSIEPELSALGVHVRFAKRERINVRLVLQVRQGVVDEPVCTFVGTDGIYYIQHGCVMVETPVVFCDFGGRVLGPLREAAFFNVFDAFLLSWVSGRGDHR
jgi:hypothetical protein